MRLRRLSAEGFRNLASLDIALDAQFVVLHGPNAQGKTNSLEAIHLLATLKPLRGRRLRDLVAWTGAESTVAGVVESGGVARTYRVELGPTGRVAKLDGKRLHDLAEYFAGVRAIAFTPTDGRIVAGEPARRRDWLDRAAFTASPAHLGYARAYRQCLAQKAAALKQPRPDASVLDVLDEQLAQRGAELAERRIAMLMSLLPHVVELHEGIAGGHGAIDLRYATQAVGEDVAQRRAALRQRLVEVRPKELQRRTTLAGPQLDDVHVTLDGQATRKFGSRGQIRSVVLALKLAEMVAARARGDVPLFLIDDASTELDAGRTSRLVGLLSELGGQVFATTTDAGALLQALPSQDTQEIAVSSGILRLSN